MIDAAPLQRLALAAAQRFLLEAPVVHAANASEAQQRVSAKQAALSPRAPTDASAEPSRPRESG
jgi:hypothetical protein